MPCATFLAPTGRGSCGSHRPRNPRHGPGPHVTCKGPSSQQRCPKGCPHFVLRGVGMHLPMFPQLAARWASGACSPSPTLVFLGPCGETHLRVCVGPRSGAHLGHPSPGASEQACRFRARAQWGPPSGNYQGTCSRSCRQTILSSRHPQGKYYRCKILQVQAWVWSSSGPQTEGPSRWEPGSCRERSGGGLAGSHTQGHPQSFSHSLPRTTPWPGWATSTGSSSQE